MFGSNEFCPSQIPLGAPSGRGREVEEDAAVPVYPVLKRGADLVFALVLLFLTWPLMLLGIVLMRLTSSGAAIYKQTRLGRHGQPFVIFKIRSMYTNCESLTGACWSRPGDPRITPVGRWLRRTHIDELPQLWNVIRGDMS